VSSGNGVNCSRLLVKIGEVNCPFVKIQIDHLESSNLRTPEDVAFEQRR
jgi:hypothetical protein